MSEDASLKARAAAFEQWSGGGGNPHAEWIITRVEAAHVFGALRGRIARLEARLAEVTAERDEWKVEADRRGWPKEAAQEYHRMKVDLPRAEAQLAVAREALLAARHELGFVTQLPADAAVKAHAIVDTALAQLDGEQRG